MNHPTVNDFVAWYAKAQGDDDHEYLNGTGWDDIEALVERAKVAPGAAVAAYQQFVDGKWQECSEFVAKGWGEIANGCRALYAQVPVAREDGEEIVSDLVVAHSARRALGTWLAWPDAPRDGPVNVTNEQVENWLSGLPNALATTRPVPGLEQFAGFIYALLAPGQDASRIIAANPDRAREVHRWLYERKPHPISYDAMMEHIARSTSREHNLSASAEELTAQARPLSLPDQIADHANCSVGEELVERVARAINLIRFEDDGSNPGSDDIEMARAALAAMPTPAAIRAETTALIAAWLRNAVNEDSLADSIQRGEHLKGANNGDT